MIITSENNFKALDEWLADRKKVLLVCDSSIRFMDRFCLQRFLDGLCRSIRRKLLRFGNRFCRFPAMEMLSAESAKYLHVSLPFLFFRSLRASREAG